MLTRNVPKCTYAGQTKKLSFNRSNGYQKTNKTTRKCGTKEE